MAYGLTAIRAAIKTDLEAIATPTQSFSVADVDETGDEDITILDTPALQLVSVEGSADAHNWRSGQEATAFELDLFAKDGELETLDKAVADIRNALESPTSTIRTTTPRICTICSVTSWGNVEGAEVQRSATHRSRLVVEVIREYERGSA